MDEYTQGIIFRLTITRTVTDKYFNPHHYISQSSHTYYTPQSNSFQSFLCFHMRDIVRIEFSKTVRTDIERETKVKS